MTTTKPHSEDGIVGTFAGRVIGETVFADHGDDGVKVDVLRHDDGTITIHCDPCVPDVRLRPQQAAGSAVLLTSTADPVSQPVVTL